ncbi:MAG: hypothetical protein JEZ11_07430 [Desulfobacterales bacterium]|nr:hypothetical protein [Desulfobacterales bacterium]
MIRRPLKTHLMVYLIVLLVTGMGLVEVIATVAFERVLLEEKKTEARHFIDTVRFQAMENGDVEVLRQMIGHVAPDCYGFYDNNGRVNDDEAIPCVASEALSKAATNAIESIQPSMTYTGSTWGVFWPQPRYLVAAAGLPNRPNGQPMVVAVAWDLQSLYQRLRQTQKAMMAYIFINTLILTMVGFKLLWNATGRPISRLVKRAEEFSPQDALFLTPEANNNEFDKLSRSLNSMLKRISQDQEKLRATVHSLEKANAELVQAQKDVIRAEKLASTGRLASGVAHEIGNPIGIVLGYLDLLRQEQISLPEKLDFIDRAQSEIQRINTIIRQLLDLSRPSASGSGPVSIHRLIEDLLNVMNCQPAVSGISMSAELNAEQDTVSANEDQLRQVFLNLILNASDAIHATGADSGTLRITTSLSDHVKSSSLPPKPPQVVVRFEDNGTGIELSQIENIFDPFFTTKAPGKGTGLGLSVCFSIVERLGGGIFAENLSGRGTAVSVCLPLYQTQ